MLTFLAFFRDSFGPFRLFDYVTFRAGGAALTSFLIVVLLGGWTARTLRRLNAQAAERLAGLVDPQFIDKEKSKTPCMGGVLLIGAILLASLLWMQLNSPIPCALILATAAFAGLGFIDDFFKVFYKRRDGLSAKMKFAGQILIAIAALYLLGRDPVMREYLRQLMVPFFKQPVYQGWWCLPLSVIVVVGASNAVNLTDGKDGLATGCTIFCALTYAVFAYLMSHKIFAGYLNIPFLPGAEEAMVFGSALCGGCIGFLWHNCHPAAMFMGDTGSLALGGAVGLLATVTRQEILLLLVGGIYVMEAVSVILQVGSFKLTGKRIFLCAPIHHHFERKGWTETQIVVRFWIIAGVCALLALASLKLR